MANTAIESMWRVALGAVRPLDEARAAVLRKAAPVTRPLFADRGLRVLLYACVSIAVAFAITCISPAFLLAVGPIVLGVPHLMADARYLVVQRGLHRRTAFWICVCAPCTLVWSSPRVWVGLVATLGAIAIARAPVVRKMILAVAILALAFFAYAHRGVAEVWMAHAHNIIALVLWVAVYSRSAAGASTAAGARDRKRGIGALRHQIVIAMFLTFSALLFVLPIATSTSHPFGVDMAAQARSLSPFANSAISPRFVLFFAFAQSVHYAIWLRVVPEEARPRDGMRGFASSVRALRKDLGLFVLVGFIGLALFFVGWAAKDLWAARVGYLNLAITHGYLEVAVLALLVLEGRKKSAA